MEPPKTPAEMYDAVLGRVHEIQIAMDAADKRAAHPELPAGELKRRTSGAITAVWPVEDPTVGGKGRVGNPSAEYLADFWKVARRVLEQRWPKQWEVFQVYHYGRARYTDAIKQLRVPASTFDYWSNSIKKNVGRELRRAGLYPPSRYFSREKKQDGHRSEERTNHV